MNLRRSPSQDGKSQQRINDQIHVREVRVIDENGTQLGILNIRKALELAAEAELDLVEVAPNEKPPVCRIMDYGKFKYQLAKKQNKSTSAKVTLKEIRLRPGTGQNDVLVKVNAARGFLQKKDKVLVSIVFQGRELAHFQEGERMMQQVVELLADVGKPDSKPARQGKRLSCVLSPV